MVRLDRLTKLESEPLRDAQAVVSDVLTELLGC
jgi:hypothetical protein